MTDTFEQARDRIFEEFGIERPRMAFFGVDLAHEDQSDAVRYMVNPSQLIRYGVSLIVPGNKGRLAWL